MSSVLCIHSVSGGQELAGGGQQDGQDWSVGADGPLKRENSNSNSNSKTLFYKDCSLGSFKNLSNN